MQTPRRGSALVVAVAVALTTWLLTAPAPSGASSPATQRDAATAEGYDYHSLMSADVVANSSGNNVVIRYAAARAIEDGVLRIVVPRAAWATDLQPVAGLYEFGPPGGFSVRPGIAPPGVAFPEPTLPTDRTCQPATFGDWRVSQIPGAQLITIRGINCAAGREFAVRLEGLQAPRRTGVYAFPMLMTPSGAAPRLAVARIRVVAPPRTRLVVSLPPTATVGVPFLVTVTALKPNGRPALGYRGVIAIDDPGDCTLSPPAHGVAHQFAAADRGTANIMVQLDQLGTHQLTVYDIARRAVPTVSSPFEMLGEPSDTVNCPHPVSYH